MKRLMVFVLGFIYMFTMAGCNSKSTNDIIESKPNVTEIVEDEEKNVTDISFEGEYAAYDTDESMLCIQKNEDETYSIQIGVYRLVQLDNCLGVVNGEQLEFSTMEWGEDQEITGTITLDGDNATVMLYAPWSDTWFKDVNEYQYYKISGELVSSIENEDTEDVSDIVISEAHSIQEEIARVEEQSREHCNADTSTMGQQQMNRHSAEWYMLWDEELNSLWSRLSDELDEEAKEKVLAEQRAWIKRKEGNAKAAGIEALFGSLQPLLESETAGAMTRARAYILAGYLAEVRNESFTISPEIQESLDAAEPKLDEVFEKFEGQWIFDESRGACVGIERTETCAYGVEGSNWTIWVTGGDLFSDIDVYGYTEGNILFKLSSGVYYNLSFGMEGELFLEYMPSLSIDAINDYDIIICE